MGTFSSQSGLNDLLSFSRLRVLLHIYKPVLEVPMGLSAALFSYRPFSSAKPVYLRSVIIDESYQLS
jgi:hypothetical protein